jgi:hypothetical protein
VLFGQGYHAPHGAVIDEYGAMVEWGNQRIRRKPVPVPCVIIYPIKYQHMTHHKSHEATKPKLLFNFTFVCRSICFCIMCHGEPNTHTNFLKLTTI